TELSVAAFNQLPKRGMGEPCGHDVRPGRGELTSVTGEGLTLALVKRRDIDDKRGPDRIVDEVLTDPVGAPGGLAGVVASQAAAKDGLRQHPMGGDMIGMPIVGVRNCDGPGLMRAN